MNVTVIGDGGWGTAIALLLNGYGHRVTIWGPFEAYLDEVRACRENTRFLKGVALPLDKADCENFAAAKIYGRGGQGRSGGLQPV